LLAHGGGGRLMQRLIEELFLPAFGSRPLAQQHDGALLQFGEARLAFTTDSFVVKPLFFPGGSIGTLAINGTVNDLAMCGARPLYLSAGFILEEGLPMATLAQVAAEMQAEAKSAGVALVTGDTKVVDRGKGDGVFINTAGIGLVEHQREISPKRVREGDAIILSGDIGRHGMAIMAQREGLEFESQITSDCAPLNQPVQALLDAGIDVHCLRDCTRGGLGAVLVEIAYSASVHLEFSESDVPVREDVLGACELLGLDPLYVANEGRFAAFVAPADAQRTVELLRQHETCREACLIGHVQQAPAGRVTVISRIGARRIVDLPSGEQLPRIC